MATECCLRLRLVFDDPSILTPAQRSEGMNNSWILLEPNQHPKISDVCNHLQRIFNLRTSCPNGIHLFMEEFVLPPSESTRILKDKDIICVKRKGMVLAEAIEGADACNLLDDGEVNKREPVDNGMLLLANEEFDKETGGYKSESEEEKWEEEPSPKETASKKRKASAKLQSSKKKKKRLVVMDNVEDEVATEDTNINNDELLPMGHVSKKVKTKKAKKNDESETIIVKVKSPSEVKRKKKHYLGLLNGAEAEAEVVTDEIDNVNNCESLPRKIINKKIQPNKETNKANGETSGKNIKTSPDVKRAETLQDKVKGAEQASIAPNEDTKAPSRSARRKKAKRRWRRELAKISQQPDTHLQPEVSKSENKEANGHTEGPEDQVTVKIVHENIVEQGGTNHNDSRDTEYAPRVVRPGHIRFEPLDEGEDAQETQALDVAFEWNGITSKKKGQKWGIEKSSTSRRDDSEKANKEPSPMLTADTQVPSIDLNDCDQLPLCSSPKLANMDSSLSSSPSLSSSSSSSFAFSKLMDMRKQAQLLISKAIPLLLDPYEEKSSLPRMRQTAANRGCQIAHERLIRDHFADNSYHDDETFRRRFRMSKRLFQRIFGDLEREFPFFKETWDASGRKYLSPLLKCTSAIRQMAYGTNTDSLDDYLGLSEETSRECIQHFSRSIVKLYGKQYLRKPNYDDIQKLYIMHESMHGFPGMLGSVGYTRWKWENFPVEWRDQYMRGDYSFLSIMLEVAASHDLWILHAFFSIVGSSHDLHDWHTSLSVVTSYNNIDTLTQSPLLNDAYDGKAPECPFQVNGVSYRHGYYLASRWYPGWATFVKAFTYPMEERKTKFKFAQESARNDVERAFGALKQRWNILDNPTRSWHPTKIRDIMYACIILHNMILEDEGRTICSFDANNIQLDK